MPDVAAFGQALGHPFKRPELAVQALTHASVRGEQGGAVRTPNTRQEYVGDAVLELAVRAILTARFPTALPGQLDSVKQAAVANAKLGPVMRSLGLAGFLERGGSRPPDSDKLLAQLFEASIGAVFLDADFETARRIVERHVPLPHELP